MREQKFRFIFKDGNFFAKRYMTLDELLDSNFALEQMEESINSESNIFEIEDYPEYEVFKDEYTGLKDAINKNEIYEHDIINILGVGFLKVEWDYRDTGWICLDKHYKKRNLAEVLMNGGIRVGNIHENKELITKVK